MKIAFFDKKTLGDDLDFSIFDKNDELKFYETTNSELTKERIKDIDIIVTNKVKIREEELTNAKKLKLICVAATGYNNIDMQAANKYDIPVTNVKAYSTESVAELTLSFMLNLMNSGFQYRALIKKGAWQKSPVFTMLNHPFIELKGKKLGIIGYGSIGKRVAEIAKAFGMELLITARQGVEYNDIKRYSLSDVLKQSDIVTIHTPLSPQTANLIDEKELKLMKQSAFIINMGRGGIINEEALYQALKDNTIAGAATDVLTQEPPKDGHKLFDLDNIIITPHIAWTSKEARTKLLEGIRNNIEMYKQGKIDEIKL